MILLVIGALAVGLSLGMFGSGGSILTVPVLLYVLQHEDKVAIAESLGIVGAIALVSAIPYARDRLVDWRTAVLFGFPGMVGTYFGAWIAGFVAGIVQLLFFAAVMLIAAVMMWRQKTTPSPVAISKHRRAIAKVVSEGLAVGVLTGFVGVGGGFLIVPALVLLARIEMRVAVGTSLVIIALKSTTGFWKYQDVLASLDLAVDWGTVGLFTTLGIVGSMAGNRLNAAFNQEALKRGFAVLLVVMAVFIAGKELLDLTLAPSQAA